MKMDEKDTSANNTEACLNALGSTTSLDICAEDTAVSSTATAEEGDDSGDPVEKKWSSLLQSPMEPSFSPSLPVGKSLHGLALTVTVERTKNLTKCGKRCANLLYGVSELHDNFSQAILRATQTYANCQISGTPIEHLAKEVQTSLMSFGKQEQILGSFIKTSVAKPWDITYATMEQSVLGIFQPYMNTRDKCIKARQDALLVQKKYAKLIKEAKSSIRQAAQLHGQQPQQERQSSPTQPSSEDTAHTNTNCFWVDGYGSEQLKLARQQPGLNRHADRFLQLLDALKAVETDYVQLVREENQAVERAQTMELIGLESLQKLEEDRLESFVDAMKRLIQADMNALDNMSLALRANHANTKQDNSTNRRRCHTDPAVSTPSSTATLTSPTTTTTTLRSKGRFANAISESSAVTEAVALNLPEEAGMMRDKVQENLAKRTARCAAIKSLYQFSEDLISATESFATGLRCRLAQDGYYCDTPVKGKDQLLAVTYKRAESPRVHNFWISVLEDLQNLSSTTSHLATELAQSSQAKNIRIASSLERDIKSVKESEDMRWKHLSEAAKDEGKVRVRLEQYSSDLARARERLNATLSEEPQRESDERALEMKPQYRKALGQMFSILPGGGEEAMAKMLSLKQRQEIARVNVLELEEKVEKEMTLLKNATFNKSKSYASYTSAAKALDDAFCNEEESRWDFPMNVLESLIVAFSNFRSKRYSNLRTLQSTFNNVSSFVDDDTRKWVKTLQSQISMRQKNHEHVPNETYSLSPSLIEGASVRNLLSLVYNNSENNHVSDQLDDSLCSDKLDGEHQEVAGEESPSFASKDTLIQAKDSQQRSPQALPAKDSDIPTEASPISTSTAKSTETNLFVTHFWDKKDGEDPPTIIESYSCAYWPKVDESGLFMQHGRMFATGKTMFFVGWGTKKVVFDWENVISLEKETTAMGIMDNAINIKCREGNKEISYFFGSFASRDSAFQLMKQLVSVAKSLREINGSPSVSAQEVLPDVPPDKTLQKMDLLLNNTLKGVSVSNFFNAIWSEEDLTRQFYKPLLLKKGNQDVDVGEWEISVNDNGFIKTWCGETYERRRKVTYRHVRTTHLYIGPPIANVSETHHCRVDGQNKCVFVMTVEIGELSCLLAKKFCL